MPAVTVITPCYNVQRFLAETVESVLSQTATDWEYIIVNDGSSDESAAIAEQYAARDNRVTVIHQENQGVAMARQNGYAHASPDSRYLLWLDGDDVLEPRMIEVLSTYLDSHPEAGIAFSDRTHIDDDSQPLRTDWVLRRVAPGWLLPRTIPCHVPATPFASLFVQDAVTTPSATLVRRTAYEASGGFNPALRPPGDDWDFVFNVALVSEAHFVNHKLLRYRLRQGQITGNKERALQGYTALYDKWSRLEDVPAEKQTLVQQAIRFREGRVLPMQWLGWSAGLLRRGQLGAGIHCLGVSAKYAARYTRKSLSGAYRQ